MKICSTTHTHKHTATWVEIDRKWACIRPHWKMAYCNVCNRYKNCAIHVWEICVLFTKVSKDSQIERIERIENNRRLCIDMLTHEYLSALYGVFCLYCQYQNECGSFAHWAQAERASSLWLRLTISKCDMIFRVVASRCGTVCLNRSFGIYYKFKWKWLRAVAAARPI